MALCTITGTVYLPSGGLARSKTIAFRRSDRKITAEYLGVVLPTDVLTRTDVAGLIEVELLTGVYTVFAEGFSALATVPDAGTAYFSDIIALAEPIYPAPTWLNQAFEARNEAVAAAGDAAGSADAAAVSASEAAAKAQARVTQTLPYPSRAEAVVAIATGNVEPWVNIVSWFDGIPSVAPVRLSVSRRAGATTISDMVGWRPSGEAVYAEHFGPAGTGNDDTAYFAAALAFGRKVTGLSGRVYILGDLNVSQTRANLDLSMSTVRRATGAKRALDVSGAYSSVIVGTLDTPAVMDQATRLADPAVVLATTITAFDLGAKTVTVADASLATVGMFVFYHAEARLAMTAASPTPTPVPPEQANYITDITGNVLTLAHALPTNPVIGGKMVGDHAMIRLTGFGSNAHANIRNCVVGWEIGTFDVVLGATNARASGVVERVIGAGIVHTVNAAAEVTHAASVLGGLNIDRFTVADAAQTTFPYDWNISPRIHRGGSERSLSVTVDGTPAAISSIDMGAGTVTLATPCAGGETVRCRNNEYVARGLYYCGVGGSTTGTGVITGTIVIAASVCWEINGVESGGVAFCNANGTVLDTGSYIGIWLRGATGFDFSGVKTLYCPYPIVISEGAKLHSFSSMATTFPEPAAIENISAYPNRAPLIVDDDCYRIFVSRDTWRSNSLNWTVVDPGAKIVYPPLFQGGLPVAAYQSGIWTARFSDSSGNHSPTTVNGRWIRVGKLVTLQCSGMSNIDTTGLVAGDNLRMMLPFAEMPFRQQRWAGVSYLQQLGELPAGSVGVIYPRVSGNNDYLNFYAPGNPLYTMRVSDLVSGTSDLNDLQITYEVA